MLLRIAILSVIAMSQAAAQTYPARPVRFIVPFTPGGGADLVGRVLGQKLSETWGQQVIVDNRPGAGANIGAEIAAAAPADGYTIFQINVANTIAPSVYRKLNYDALRDFAAVTQLATTPFVLTVYPGVKAASVQELIALARAEPGKLSYASSGIGGPSHMLMELFKAMSKTDIVHVPYKGGVPALNDLTNGRIQVMFATPTVAMSQVNAGRLRALGISSPRRSTLAPEIPTISEAGVRSFEGAAWFGVVVPVKTNRDIVAKLARDMRQALQQPDVRERLATQSVEVVGSTPEEFAQFMRAEIQKWRKVAAFAGIQLE